MKRLLVVLSLILCLTFPALAGHTQAGTWCQCGTPACICDEGEQPVHIVVSDSEQDLSSQEIPSDNMGDELLLIFGLLTLMLLRYKA